ncbi:MAG: hypothetical protein KGJ58_00550 [Patescibacteria group bacterium]|nr:hypothetical protein [Patescibacteria group bacterium]MDE2217932.1 hypothetical protein [Patescibacteria group bacterium]
MKKNISWQVLLGLGLALDLIGRFLEGTVFHAIGVLGDLLFLFGVINLITTLIIKRKVNKNISKPTE